MTIEPTVEGCRHDGIAKRNHAQSWTEEAGWHAYEPPTPQQLHDRMFAVREAAALDRYQAALGRGLSDYEARAEGWPTPARDMSVSVAGLCESDPDGATCIVKHQAHRDIYHSAKEI